MVTLNDVLKARERIAGKVRRTPLVDAAPAKAPLPGRVSLKLESLQITGSFKARGSVNKLGTLSEAEIERGLVTASGGNHGLGVAYAGWLSGRPATIYLPSNTPAFKIEKLRAWGANLIFDGDVWDDANATALAAAKAEGKTYIHPFADAAVMAGQGTVALEVLEDAPDVDTFLVAIGGGGLIAGVAAAAKALKPGARVIGVEPIGAPTLHASLEAGELVTLDAITSRANTLAPRRSEAITFALIQEHVERVVLVSDADMENAARWLWFEHGLSVELSGAAAVAALLSGAYTPAEGEHVCALVCGSGTDGLAQA
jgi:threonine dehydratase